MNSGLILAIDQGTTNTKALLIDQSGEPVFRTSSSVDLISSHDGFVEQDPLALWDSVRSVLSTAADDARARGAQVEALAISNQRETAIAWDAATGEPLARAVSWQCGRSSAICERIAHKADCIRAKTGLPLAPLVSAGKWTWLLENEASVERARQESRLRLGTVDSWLISRLTKGAAHVTDLSNASRTGLLDLRKLSWDPELLDFFGIPAEALPAVRPSAGPFGTCTSEASVAGVPILAAVGDSHAAMFGHASFAPGAVKATYGTGSSLMALTSTLTPDMHSLARTIAWSAQGHTQFALEGNIPMTGSAIQWLGEFLHLPDPAAAVAELASRVPDAGGVSFVPAMVGLGAPYWEAGARGAITGLNRAHTAAHVARAALEAIAYQVADVFFAMESAVGMQCEALLVDGGATRNSALMQFQADILQRPVLRARNEELSAIGAGWLAGLELGWWNSLAALEGLSHEPDRFTPAIPESERDRLYDRWKKAVAGVRRGARAGQ